jgi:hypothetical protein
LFGQSAFFTASQVAQLWQADVANTRRRLRKLTHAGLIERTWIIAQPPPEGLDAPLCSWQVGERLPDAGRVSWAARLRYGRRPLKNMAAYFATANTRTWFGQSAPPAWKPHQASHDLAVSQLYVVYALRWPRVARLWQGEDLLAPDRGFQEMVEDALIVRERPLLGLEVGAYRADRFRARFHSFAARAIPFRCY